MEAAHKDQPLPLLKTLLDAAADVNRTDKTGHTALLGAAGNKHALTSTRSMKSWKNRCTWQPENIITALFNCFWKLTLTLLLTGNQWTLLP